MSSKEAATDYYALARRPMAHPHERDAGIERAVREGKPITVAALAFEGFELLDVFGPLEMFGLMPHPARIIMVSEHPGMVSSGQGTRIVVDRAVASIEEADVLLIPGGQGTRREVDNAGLLETLAGACERARHVACVCTGSALLARTGLLDGRRATSNKRAFHWVMRQGPRVEWIKEARWTVDGKYFTSAGVSAGIDMALALIETLCDEPTALAIAAAAEYEWHCDPDWDPFAKLAGLVE